MSVSVSLVLLTTYWFLNQCVAVSFDKIQVLIVGQSVVGSFDNMQVLNRCVAGSFHSMQVLNQCVLDLCTTCRL